MSVHLINRWEELKKATVATEDVKALRLEMRSSREQIITAMRQQGIKETPFTRPDGTVAYLVLEEGKKKPSLTIQNVEQFFRGFLGCSATDSARFTNYVRSILNTASEPTWNIKVKKDLNQIDKIIATMAMERKTPNL
jgi:hypothetical protein